MSPLRRLLVALVVLVGGCASGAASCERPTPTDILYLDGQRLFQAAFDYVKCESVQITAGELIDDGTLAVLAPSPGFDGAELVGFVAQHLQPAGLRPTVVYYYLLTEDRVGVAHLGVIGSLERSLESAYAELQRIHPPDEEPVAGVPLPFVLVLAVETTDAGQLDAALDALAASPYAFVVGDAASALPPFDPARDRSAAERGSVP